MHTSLASCRFYKIPILSRRSNRSSARWKFSLFNDSYFVIIIYISMEILQISDEDFDVLIKKLIFTKFFFNYLPNVTRLYVNPCLKFHLLLFLILSFFLVWRYSWYTLHLFKNKRSLVLLNSNETTHKISLARATRGKYLLLKRLYET